MRCYSLITYLIDCVVCLLSLHFSFSYFLLHAIFYHFYLYITVSVCKFMYLGVFSSIYLSDIYLCVLVCGLFRQHPPPTHTHTRCCFVVTPRILISLSWCTPGLSCGQIAALFISLVINITRCTATFAGNNADNGASALSLFFSILFFLRPHCCGRSHFCEQQAQFYLQAIWIFTHFFQPSFHLCWMVLSLAAGYRLWLPSRAAPQRLHVCWITITCWLDGSLPPDVTAVPDCPSTWCRRTKLLYWNLRSCSICCRDMN